MLSLIGCAFVMNSMEKGFMLQRSLSWSPDTQGQIRLGWCSPLGCIAGREIREGPFCCPSVPTESMDPELREGQAASPCWELNLGSEGEVRRSILHPLPTSVLSSSCLTPFHCRPSHSPQPLNVSFMEAQ